MLIELWLNITIRGYPFSNNMIHVFNCGPYYQGAYNFFISANKITGEVTEWLKVLVSKTSVGATLPRVQIPLSPPLLAIVKKLIFLGIYKL